MLFLPRLETLLLICWPHALLMSTEAAFVPSMGRSRLATLRKSWPRHTSSRADCVGNTSQSLDGTKTMDTGLPTGIDHREKSHVEMEYEQLRQKARELRNEVAAMELTMNDARSAEERSRGTERDAMIDHLFSGNMTVIALCSRMDTERWSPDQLMLVVDRFHERQVQARGNGSIGKSPLEGFQLADVRNSGEEDNAEWERLDSLLKMLMEAAGALDEKYANGANRNKRWTGRVALSLSSRLKELRRTEDENFKRRLAATMSSPVSRNSNATMQEYMSKSLGLPAEGQSSRSFNMSRVMEQVSMVPMWVPSTILPFLLVSRVQLQVDDVKRIKEEVLMGTSFYCTSSDSIAAAAVFRGNLRPPAGPINTTLERNHSAVVFDQVQQNLERAGMSDRIQLFLWNDPEWRPTRDEPNKIPPPVLLALPKAIVPEQPVERSISWKVLAGASVVFTATGTFAYAVSCYALNPSFFQSVINQKDVGVIAVCLPLFVGVLLIQAAHESAHRFMADRRGVKIGLPIPLPSSQIGTFGNITPLRSFPPSRVALLDFALSGPVAGMVVSTLFVVGGIYATLYASSETLSYFPVVPAAILKSSFFVGSLLSVLAPKTMLLPLAQPIPVHPTFMIGFAGLVSNALNMLPIGRLDGGRAYSAVFGSRNAALASLATLTLMSLLSLTGMSAIAIFWGLLVVVFQRQPEIPVRNEVTEVDDVRVGLYSASLALALLALAPFPGGQGML